MAKSLMRKIKARHAERQFFKALDSLRTGDIVLDCGANVGDITLKIAKTPALVYAFEPNPHAFKVLRKKTRGMSNVIVINKAVIGDTKEKLKLFFHQNSKEDPVGHSTGSSLLDSKSNISTLDYVLVDGVSLGDFIKDLTHLPRLVKMDIEGAEIEVINDLLDRGINEKIQFFVELHDEKNSELKEVTKNLKTRIKTHNLQNFNLNWR